MIVTLDKAQDYLLQYLTAALAKGWYQTPSNRGAQRSFLPVLHDVQNNHKGIEITPV